MYVLQYVFVSVKKEMLQNMLMYLLCFISYIAIGGLGLEAATMTYC